MDVARDLQDHQLFDRDGNACGRIDDTLIQWDEQGEGQLGPMLSGGAVLLDQLGRLGRILRPILRFSGARREVSIDWALVGRIEHSAIHVVTTREGLALTSSRRT
jgi:sporulation protein YlmC with PRC-barrel domain